jgi:hypothetical protein
VQNLDDSAQQELPGAASGSASKKAKIPQDFTVLTALVIFSVVAYSQNEKCMKILSKPLLERMMMMV